MRAMSRLTSRAGCASATCAWAAVVISSMSAAGTPPELMAQVSSNERLRTFLSRFSASAH